jgi:hypothetical protein
MGGQRQSRAKEVAAGEATSERASGAQATHAALEQQAIVGNQALLRHRGEAGPRPPAPPVDAIASGGASGSGAPLPFLEQIRASFGRHEVGHVRAFTGAHASTAAKALSARAFTRGSSVVFGRAPDLRTAAHEAAHVVQQRGGVQLKGEVGEAGDVHERNADAVAERVVWGRSAEDLLERYASDRSRSVGRPVTQLWGEPDHYAIGQRAGITAVALLDLVDTDKEQTYKLKADEEDLSEDKDYMQDPSAATEIVQVDVPSAAKLRLRGPTGAPMSLGAANRFAGDFTKKPLESELTHKSPSLDEMPEKIATTLVEERRELRMRSATVGDWQAKREIRIHKEYLGVGFFAEKTLMATNANHFFPLSTIEYRRQHAQALQKVWVARRLWAKAGASAETEQADALKREANEAFRQAVMIEGFAGHFLADCFAAGHLAPHALGRIGDKSPVTAGARVNTWHDLFNALPDGIPTTLGTFHGDYSMDGNDLEYVSGVIAQSLLEVMMPWYAGQPYDGNVVTPKPDIAAIRGDPVAGPLWRTMCGDYDSFFQTLQASSGRRRTKMGLSKYILYATSAGSEVAKDEIMPMIAEHVFGGDEGLERTGQVQDEAGIRGKIHTIVAALHQVLDWRAGLQEKLKVGQDYLPKGRYGGKKYLISLRSAQLAKVSPTSNPRKALIEELAYWTDAWRAALKARKTADAAELALYTRVSQLQELAKNTKDEDREIWEERVVEVLTGFGALQTGLGLASPRSAPIEQAPQGPDVETSADSSSGMAIRPNAEVLEFPDLDQDLLQQFLGGVQAVLSDPRPRLDSDHDQLYDLLAETAETFSAHLGLIYRAALPYYEDCIRIYVAQTTLQGFARTVRALKREGRSLIKTRTETYRRDAIKRITTELSVFFTVDADRLMATTGRRVR